MQIPVLALPDNAPVIAASYTMAIAIVDQSLVAVPGVYSLAVYNLGGDGIIQFAPDQSGRDYFAKIRDKLNIANFSSGVNASSSDVSTSQSSLNPDFMRNLMLSDLQHLKTPWGRQYLQFAQRIGTLWGMT